MWARKAILHDVGEQKDATYCELFPSFRLPWITFMSYSSWSLHDTHEWGWYFYKKKKKRRNSINKTILYIIQERIKKYMEFSYLSIPFYITFSHHWDLEQIYEQGLLEVLSFLSAWYWCCNTATTLESWGPDDGSQQWIIHALLGT